VRDGIEKEHCIITSIDDEYILADEEESSEPAHASNRCGHIIFETQLMNSFQSKQM
jgi:hypothetical protein